MKRCAALGALFAALCLLPASASHAQSPAAKPWVQAIDIRSQDAVAQAAAVSVLIKRELSRPAEAGFQLDSLLRELSCPERPDSACLARIGGRVEADQFVWGYAQRTPPSSVLFELHMYSRGEPERYTEMTVSDTLLDPSNPALARQVQSAMAVLITRGGPAALRLRFGNLGGQILVDGRATTELVNGQAALSLRPGEHRIEIRSPGYLPASRTVFVQPTSNTDLVVEPHVDPAAEPKPSTPINWHKNLGWGAIGAGAVFTGLGIYSMTKVTSINNSQEFETWRAYSTGDICTEAKAGKGPVNGVSASTIEDKCNTSDLHSTLQWVFYGTAALSFGTGIYLLATNPGDKTPKSAGRLQLLPSVGKQSARIEARYTF